MTGTIIRSISRRLHTERLGHHAIDSDHIEISECWFQAVNCKPIQFTFLIARLRKLMFNHFSHEDAIMRHAASSLCSCHRQEHEMLLSLCDRAAELGKFDWRAAQRVLRHDFPKQVREHIICMDQMLVLHINTSKEGTMTGTSKREDFAG